MEEEAEEIEDKGTKPRKTDARDETEDMNGHFSKPKQKEKITSNLKEH